jgi:hypothetical protein
MATETESKTNESDYHLDQIDMAMKSVSYCYFQAKASDDKTHNGISSEAWLKCINYLGILKLEKDATTRPTEKKRDSDI